MAKPLTHAQQRLLDLVRSYTAKHGMAPTLREMADGLGMSDLKNIREQLERIEAAGYITRLSHLRRGIRLKNTGLPEVPVYGKISAGQPLDWVSDFDETLTVPPGWFRQTPDFFLRVSGDSMIDEGILHDDLVGLKRTQSPRSGQIVAVHIDTTEMSRAELREAGVLGGLTLKTLQITRNKVILHSANQARGYAPMTLHPDRVRIEGLYVGLVRL